MGGEVGNTSGRLVLGVGGDVASLDVVANVVAGDGLGQGLVVHLDGLDLSGKIDRSKGDHHAGLDHTSLHTTHRHCSNASNFVNILEGQPEGLVGGSAGGNDGVKSLKKGHAVGLAFLPLDVPALVPAHVGGSLNHVVAMPSRDGHEGNSGRVVADLLDETRHLLLDLIEPSLGVWRLGGVHLVTATISCLTPRV